MLLEKRKQKTGETSYMDLERGAKILALALGIQIDEVKEFVSRENGFQVYGHTYKAVADQGREY